MSNDDGMSKICLLELRHKEHTKRVPAALLVQDALMQHKSVAFDHNS